MKNIIVLVLLTLLIACKDEPKKSKYFEGYVDYKVETVALDTSQRVQRFIKKSGKSMRCFFKNGRYVREYFDSNNISTIRILADEITGRIITINRNLQAYYYSTVDERNKKDWVLLDSTLSDIILGKKCSGLRCSSVYIENDQNFTMLGTFYYCNELLLDNSNALSRDDPFYNYWKNKFASVMLRTTEEIIGKVKTTYTAYRIVSTRLSDTLFTVPADKPLIHYPD